MAEQEITQTPEFEKLMAEATSPEQIRELLHAEAARQGIDIPNAPKVTVTETGDVVLAEDEDKKDDKQSETKDEAAFHDDFVIGGKSYHFEGDSVADILRQVKAATDVLASTQEKKVETKQEEKKGVTEDDKIAAELDFKTGKITADEYFDRIGAFDTYLAKKGINLDELKEVVAEKTTNKIAEQWQSATEEFLNSNKEWPGGEQNQKIMMYTLRQLDLGEKPSLDSLNKAYAQMKSDGLVIAYEAPKQQQEPVKKKVTGSAMFGVGGGDSQRDKGNKTITAPTITPQMTGAEIMELYKQSAKEQGIHPDEFLMSGSRR